MQRPRSTSSLSSITEKQNQNLENAYRAIVSSPAKSSLHSGISSPQLNFVERDTTSIVEEDFNYNVNAILHMVDSFKQGKSVTEFQGSKSYNQDASTKKTIKKNTEALEKGAKMTNRQFVAEQLKKMKENPDELDRVEREVELYEQKLNEVKQKVLSGQENKIGKNKILAKEFSDLKKKQIQEESSIRKQKLIYAKEKRVTLYHEFMQKKIEIVEKDDEKRVKAEQRKQHMMEIISNAERKMKWSFLAVFFNRFTFMESHLRQYREQQKQIRIAKRVKHIVDTIFMPIVRRLRSQKWRGAWDAFQKHWLFYRLYVDIKKKKESIGVIKTFLTDSKDSLSIVRQTKLFRSRVVKIQQKCKTALIRNNTRLSLNLLQYCVVEAKLLTGKPLFYPASDRIETPTWKPLEKCYEYSFGKENVEVAIAVHQIDEIDENVGKGGKKGRKTSKVKKKSSRPATAIEKSSAPIPAEPTIDSNALLDDSLKFWLEKDSFLLYQATHEIRVKILLEDLKRRRSEYIDALAKYEEAFREYLERLKQYEYYVKASNMLQDKEKGGFDDEPRERFLKSFIDQEGNEIIRPEMPAMNVYISERQMKELVIKGFELIKEEEGKMLAEINPKFVLDEDRAEEKKKRREQWQSQVDQTYTFIQKYLTEDMMNQYLPSIKVTRRDVDSYKPQPSDFDLSLQKIKPK